MPKKIRKERHRAVANYPHSIRNVQGPIDENFNETIYSNDALSSSIDAILYSISLPKLFLLGSLRT